MVSIIKWINLTYIYVNAEALKRREHERKQSNQKII